MAPTPTWNELLGWQRAWFERGYEAALLAVGTPETYPPTAQEAYGKLVMHRRAMDQPAAFKVSEHLAGGFTDLPLAVVVPDTVADLRDVRGSSHITTAADRVVTESGRVLKDRFGPGSLDSRQGVL